MRTEAIIIYIITYWLYENVPAHSIIVHIHFSQTTHHFQLIVCTICLNLFFFFSTSTLKCEHTFKCTYGVANISRKLKLFLTGKGKQFVTSSTLPISRPRSWPVTSAGMKSLQCFIIFNTTCSQIKYFLDKNLSILSRWKSVIHAQGINVAFNFHMASGR